jgi:DNA-binding NarL/FixJ family response regulator
MIRVLVADDEALVRGGIRMILDAQSDIRVIGEAVDGARAVRLARELAPDLVLMDVRMPVLDGLEATRRLLAGAGGSRVLMLTTFDRDEYLYDALRAGASGFLLKSVPPEQLVGAVRIAAAGEALLAPAITRRLIEQFVRRPAPGTGRPAVLAALTDREVDVLRLVARGRTNAEIAADLFLSEGTVKTHINRLLRKLDLRDRVQAVVLAYESGLVQPGEAYDRRT